MPEVFEINPHKQYILAGDISGSMQTKDPLCKDLPRYSYMLEKFGSFIKRSEDFDPDGPTVLLWGQKVHVYENTTFDAVNATLARPNFEGYTNTHLAVQKAYDLHRAQKKASTDPHPGTVLMLFTDGEPTERKALKDTIVRIANEIERDEEFSITILTVGTIDVGLRKYLKELDDELKGLAKYDIVDVKALEEVDFLGAVTGAIAD